MAYKFILFAILSCVFLVQAEECDCKNDKTVHDAQEMLKFLRHLSTHGEREQRYPVVPGELAPLVPCANCLPKNRRKRYLRVKWGCPYGFFRLGFSCINRRRFVQNQRPIQRYFI